jgi:hypothetical protein
MAFHQQATKVRPPDYTTFSFEMRRSVVLPSLTALLGDGEVLSIALMPVLASL